MYRKHLRMARGKGEVESRPIRSHFVERIVSLPMVHVALDYASNTYSTIKEYNRIVNFTLTNAEKSVTFVAGHAKPVVLKFEKQIQAVDDFACRGLGSLEDKVPLITKSADEILDDTKDLYTTTIHNRFEGIVKYGNDRVRTVAKYGIQKVSVILDNSIVNSVLGTVDGALVATEHYIDFVLPPEIEEEKNHVNSLKKDTDDEDDVSTVDRLYRISSTVRRRLVIRVRMLRDRTLDIFNLPEHMLSFFVENFEDLNRYARSLWVILNAEETPEQQQSRNYVSKKVFPLARPLLKQLVVLYISIAELVPLPARKNKNNSTNNNTAHPPVLVSTVADGVERVLGLIRVVPALLPIYLYTILSWINLKREPTKTNDVCTNNGIKFEPVENNHVHEDHKIIENDLD